MATASTPDFGSDISCIADIDASFAVVTGPTALAQAIARRLTTPRGALPYAPDYGTDVRLWLNDSFTTAQAGALQAAIEQEVEQDERVLSASAFASYDSTAQALAVSLQLDTAEGPFGLVLSISATTVQILEAT